MLFHSFKDALFKVNTVFNNVSNPFVAFLLLALLVPLLPHLRIDIIRACLSLLPGDLGEVTLPSTMPVKSGAVLLALFSSALRGLVQPYTSKGIITLPWVSYTIPKNNLLAYMKTCFVAF